MEGYLRNRQYLSHLLSEHYPRIVFLQELWIASCDCNQLYQDFPFMNFHVSTPDMFLHVEDKICNQGPVWQGAAVAWHNDMHGKVTTLDSNHQRYSSVRVSLGSASLLAISLYAPTSGKDEEYLECFSCLSHFIHCNKSSTDTIIIGTDSNCSVKSTPRRKAAFRSFCIKHDLRIYGSSRPTFHHNNLTSESCIDFFMISNSETIELSKLFQLCTLDNPLNLSSHDALLCSIQVPCNAGNDNNTQYSDTYTMFNQNRLVWDSSGLAQYHKLAGDALSDALHLWNVPEGIPLLCSLFSELLVKCADMSFDSKIKNTKSGGLIKSKSLKKSQSILKNAFRKWKAQGKPRSSENQARQNYLRARANMQNISRLEQNKINVKNNIYLMNANIYDKKKVYARLKTIRREKTTKPSKIVTPVGVYSGEDILEGFAADSEYLGRVDVTCDNFDNEFYRLCISDNFYIFEFKGSDQVKIPEMSRESFLNIVYKEMKTGKACDAYKLTVEHIRECGELAQECIRYLINMIINNIYYLTCPEVKVGLGTCIFKGKKKSPEQANSYRRVTVTPQLGSILDRYLNPVARHHSKTWQNPGQYGFTEGITYLFAALERGECQRWAIDTKRTCFGISLDGEAAFPNVDRDILTRELHTIGEKGDYLNYSRNVYQNTECRIKLEGKVSRKFKEHKGTRQGHVRADTHYKTYINPCLDSVNKADLGFHIGPICVGATCDADDTYVSSDSPTGLQSLLDIVSHYAKRYRVIFNTSKTKAIVTGSKLDMSFYKDTQPWKLNGERVQVADDNEHLGLVVSGWQEEQKNVDKKISKCRDSMFAMLGPTYAYRCKLSPVLQSHLWRTYNLPVLVSGLSALPIRPAYMAPLTLFHHKLLRGFLRLSQSSPIPSLYFLLGELPIASRLHIETLMLFHAVWSNPSTKLFQILKYILMMADLNSVTWANHIRLLCAKYSLPEPLSLLKTDPYSKDEWRDLIKTKVTVEAETKLRKEASVNSKMEFLSVELLGLSGRPHPALLNITTPRDVEKLRVHLKFLSGDFLTYQRRAKDRKSTDFHCRLCPASCEDIPHILTDCRGTGEVRERLTPELLNVVLSINSNSPVLDLSRLTKKTLTQFILDSGSPNLDNSIRISYDHPRSPEIFRISRDWCFSINNARNKLLKNLLAA